MMRKDSIVINSILTGLVIILLFSLVLNGKAENEIWVRKTDMPVPESHMGTALVNGKFYLIGGWLGGEPSRFFKIYDTFW